MKKTWNNFLILILALIFLTSQALAGQYKITVQVQHQGLEAALYYLGDIKGNTFTASRDFKDLKISYEDIIGDKDSTILAQFEARIERENLAPQARATSDQDKILTFNNAAGSSLGGIWARTAGSRLSSRIICSALLPALMSM